MSPDDSSVPVFLGYTEDKNVLQFMEIIWINMSAGAHIIRLTNHSFILIDHRPLCFLVKMVYVYMIYLCNHHSTLVFNSSMQLGDT